MGNFNDTDVLVLVTMVKLSKDKEYGNSLSKGVTIDMLEEIVKKSKSRVRTSLKLLMENELIAQGIKVGNKHSYVVLPEAIEWLKSIKKNIIKIDINN